MVIIYVLQGTKRRYVGITSDLPRRLREHQSTSHSGRLIGEFVVLHTESAANYPDARIREKCLKSGQGRAWLDRTYPREAT